MIRDWSSIPKQTKLVENGEIGDCWRCCIAAVLGVDASEVPHFLEQEINDRYNRSMDPDTQEWLNERGLFLACIHGSRAIGFPRWNRTKIEVPLISCGPTERSRGMGRHHAVVTIGDTVVYDPHPSEAGLTAITEQWLIFGILP